MGLIKCLPGLAVWKQQRQDPTVPSAEGQQKEVLYINKVSPILLGDGFCFTWGSKSDTFHISGSCCLEILRASRNSIPVTGFDIQGSL